MAARPLLAALLASALVLPLAASAQTTLPSYTASAGASISNAGYGFTFSGAGVDGVKNCVVSPDNLTLCGAASVAIGFGATDAYVSTSQWTNGVRSVQGFDGFTSGGGTVTFYAEVVGLPFNQPVPLDFTAYWALGTSGSAYATGSARLFGVNNLFGNLTFNGASYTGLYSQPTPYASFGSETLHATANVNTLLTITISLSAGAGGFNGAFPGGDGGAVDAIFDPMLTIDPSFTTPGYSLVFSAFPTPEPGSSALLLAGLGLLAIVGARRRFAPA